MPVLITGATGSVGRALTQRLLAEGGQVRAYVRREAPDLRAAGVHVAIGAADDVERLEAALTRVHTIVHLIGGKRPDRGVSVDWLNRETTECAVIAARAADVARFVFLSVPGADPSARNEFLAAKGKAEQHIIDSGLQYLILRSPPIEGPRRAGVSLESVVEALVAADAREAEVRAVNDLPQ